MLSFCISFECKKSISFHNDIDHHNYSTFLLCLNRLSCHTTIIEHDHTRTKSLFCKTPSWLRGVFVLNWSRLCVVRSKPSNGRLKRGFSLRWAGRLPGRSGPRRPHTDDGKAGATLLFESWTANLSTLSTPEQLVIGQACKAQVFGSEPNLRKRFAKKWPNVLSAIILIGVCSESFKTNNTNKECD